MRRRIIIGLGIYALVFLLGGLYIVKIIDGSTSKLDHLIMMHQVEILREHFLIQIKRVQTDLALAGTRHSRDFGTFVDHARTMSRVVDTCFDCHHREPVAQRIGALKLHTEAYKDALSRVMTIRANAQRLGQEEDVAFEIGEELIGDVSEMIASTGARLEAATATAFQEIERTKTILYALVGVGPLIAAGLGWFLIAGLTSPVKVLLGSTRRLKSGDLDHRVVGLRHEFGELGEAFNEMAASLKQHVLKMQRAEQMVVLGELTAGLAHEIKNPLAGIKVAMSVLEDEADLSEEDRAVIRKVGHEVARLESLMKSFLGFAKPPKPQLVDVNVNTLLDTTLAFYQSETAASRHTDGKVRIVKEFDAIPATLADPMQLQQVFLNLVINAMDAMPRGGTLSVRTRSDEQGTAIRVEIADTGKGIDELSADKIFQPFFTTKRGGTGLGLAISKQLVEQHGGSIGAAKNPGGGALFTIELPVRPLAQADVA